MNQKQLLSISIIALVAAIIFGILFIPFGLISLVGAAFSLVTSAMTFDMYRRKSGK